jgi:hypothetical protein
MKMNTGERDKFLARAMGGSEECDFSGWEGFGKLWEWARKQKWWNQFAGNHLGMWSFDGKKIYIYEDNVEPDIFADNLFEWGRSWFSTVLEDASWMENYLFTFPPNVI